MPANDLLVASLRILLVIFRDADHSRNCHGIELSENLQDVD